MIDDSLEPEGKINPEDLADGVVVVESSEEATGDEGGKSLEEVATDVRHGKWGIGQDRRRRLSEAGYNVKEVEAEVVRLLNKK